MTQFFKMFVEYIGLLFSKLNDYAFEFFDLHVPLGSTIFAFVLISCVIAMFWKGVKT